MKTIHLQATDGTPLSPADAISATSSLVGQLLPEEGGPSQRVGDLVGRIRVCKDPSQVVFDLPTAVADRLLASAAAYAAGEEELAQPPRYRSLLTDGVLNFTLCTALPPLRSLDGGRGGGR